MGAERERVDGFGRLEDGLLQAGEWYRWGPYVSERQWGTVREDYSADGNAWDYLPHDHARSRAYRWGEDGLAGFCDVHQRLCLSLALWNGRDPILKERAFGLTGPQGNHGEDVKEYWWYLDALPSHAWNRWRYHYPQEAFPYQELIDVNAHRDRYQPEYELLDTGAFDDDKYWITEVHYAKAGPDDLLMTIQVTNAGPEDDSIHVLPTAWFRNTWAWDAGELKPGLSASAAGVSHHRAPDHRHHGADRRRRPLTAPSRTCCSATTRPTRPGCSARRPSHALPEGRHQRPRRRRRRDRQSGARRDQVRVLVPDECAGRRVRRAAAAAAPGRPRRGHAVALGTGFDEVMTLRRREADELTPKPTPAAATADEAMVLRQACAGMLWGKQLHHDDVDRWLDGDPAQPEPSASRKAGRNSAWRNFEWVRHHLHARAVGVSLVRGRRTWPSRCVTVSLISTRNSPGHLAHPRLPG